MTDNPKSQFPEPDYGFEDFGDISRTPDTPDEFPDIPWENDFKSSWVKAYRHLPQRGLIQCMKHNEMKYDLRSTPADYDELCRAPSKGSYFSRRFTDNRKAREAAKYAELQRIALLSLQKPPGYWRIMGIIPENDQARPPDGWEEDPAIKPILQALKPQGLPTAGILQTQTGGEP